MAEEVCSILLEEPIVRENPTLFALNISAAAQLMMYAGLDVCTYCQEDVQTGWERPASGWDDWKVMLTKVGNLEDPQASSYALMAVRLMNQAELAYNSRIGISTTRTPPNQGSILWDKAEGR